MIDLQSSILNMSMRTVLISCVLTGGVALPVKSTEADSVQIRPQLRMVSSDFASDNELLPNLPRFSEFARQQEQADRKSIGLMLASAQSDDSNAIDGGEEPAVGLKPETVKARKWNKGSTDNFEADFKMVERLLTNSSISRSVTVSQAGNGESEQHDAQTYFDKAKEAKAAGDKALAAEYIKKAKKAMFSAGRQVGIKDSHQKKLKSDYLARIENTKALLDALKRINEEKKGQSTSLELEKQLDEKLLEADNLYKKGDLEEAKVLADGMFLLVKQAVTNLRDGETLVRSLNFGSKEEEYHYEIDRNDTHSMLVNMLLKKKMEDAYMAKQINEKMRAAKELRVKAEGEASEGKFEQAIKSLEDSTKQIIHAIRAGGIYIPG